MSHFWPSFLLYSNHNKVFPFLEIFESQALRTLGFSTFILSLSTWINLLSLRTAQTSLALGQPQLSPSPWAGWGPHWLCESSTSELITQTTRHTLICSSRHILSSWPDLCLSWVSENAWCTLKTPWFWRWQTEWSGLLSEGYYYNTLMFNMSHHSTWRNCQRNFELTF